MSGVLIEVLVVVIVRFGARFYRLGTIAFEAIGLVHDFTALVIMSWRLVVLNLAMTIRDWLTQIRGWSCRNVALNTRYGLTSCIALSNTALRQSAKRSLNARDWHLMAVVSLITILWVWLRSGGRRVLAAGRDGHWSRLACGCEAVH